MNQRAGSLPHFPLNSLVMPSCSLALIFCLLATSVGALEIRVTTRDGPVKSLIAARDEIRKRKAAGELKNEDVRVVVEPGEYALTEPIIFEPQDSGTADHPVVYSAMPAVTFSGGRRIFGFAAGKDGICSVKLPEANWRFDALWVNGVRAIRARTPNEGYFQATGSLTEPLPGTTADSPINASTIKVAPEDAASLKGLSADEMRDANVIVYHSWETSRHRLAALDVGSGALQFTGPARFPFFHFEPYHRLHFENYRAALDAPGEWFLSRDSTLYYVLRPGETPDSIRVVAPVAKQWMILRGEPENDAWVEHLRFEGFRFAHQNFEVPEQGWSSSQADTELPAAIELSGARDVRFENCEFAHTLTHAMRFGHGCTDSRVIHSHFHDLGGGGVYIGETSIPNTETGRTGGITLDNCIIQSGGRHFPGSIGVWIGLSGDNTISHCDIGDFFYTAISIGWTWGYRATPCRNNRVENCHLHHLGWGVLSDMGAVYTLGPQPGTIIRGCRVHDISCASYGGWGLYNDEGSTGIVWENNLVYRTQSAGYHQHYGRGNVIRNNIFAFSQEAQIRRSRPEEWFAFSFEQNIVLFREGKLLGHLDQNWRDGRVGMNRNLYWRTGGQPFDFAGKSFADWQFDGNDAESLVDDPLFVDAEHDDFRLRDGTPARRIGFVPFDYSAGRCHRRRRLEAARFRACVSADELW